MGIKEVFPDPFFLCVWKLPAAVVAEEKERSCWHQQREPTNQINRYIFPPPSLLSFLPSLLPSPPPFQNDIILILPLFPEHPTLPHYLRGGGGWFGVGCCTDAATQQHNNQKKNSSSSSSSSAHIFLQQPRVTKRERRKKSLEGREGWNGLSSLAQTSNPPPEGWRKQPKKKKGKEKARWLLTEMEKKMLSKKSLKNWKPDGERRASDQACLRVKKKRKEICMCCCLGGSLWVPQFFFLVIRKLIIKPSSSTPPSLPSQWEWIRKMKVDKKTFIFFERRRRRRQHIFRGGRGGGGGEWLIWALLSDHLVGAAPSLKFISSAAIVLLFCLMTIRLCWGRRQQHQAD